ncbi:MAG: TlpA family protein disulfide reductase, partial [Thermocrispum sp.]
WELACTPFIDQASGIAAANNYRDNGVTFVGVSYQDQRDAAVATLDEMGRGEPGAYEYVTDPGSRLALDFGVFGIPETFFIDRDGTIVAKITGPANYPLLAGVLDEMLAGGHPDSRTAGPIQPGPGQ